MKKLAVLLAVLSREQLRVEGIKEKLAALLGGIARNEGNRVPDYKRMTLLTERTIQGYIKRLKDAGLIEFKGDAAQTGGYYLTEKMRSKLNGK